MILTIRKLGEDDKLISGSLCVSQVREGSHEIEPMNLETFQEGTCMLKKLYFRTM
jgi:hypothetical protein